MANKNLIKRAFSVTANLPPARNAEDAPNRELEPEAAASHAQASPAPSVDLEPTPGEALSPRMELAPTAERSTAPAPRTGPGSLLAFMTDQSAVHKEVVHLRERVSAFEGAEVARRLDPATIVASSWANRDAASFDTASFDSLKVEIGNARGNIQPIKVRAIPGAAAGSPQYEIVYGHRRHRACLELGIPVLALVQLEMNDAQLFVEMERENREREDLSAWEQGVMYMRALEQGLFPSAKQMAAAIDADMGNISRAMALAKLPNLVIQAFGSPLNLQYRYASPLKEAHQRDPERLLEVAKAILSRGTQPTPSAVFAELTKAVDSGVQSAASNSAVWNDAGGNPLASLSVDRKNKVTVLFNKPMDETQRRKLSKLIDGFLGTKKASGD